MAIADRFIRTLYEFRGEHLTISAGAPVLLHAAGEQKKITAQAPKPDQVLNIIREIAPPEALQALSQGSPQEFQYQSPVGPVHAQAAPENGSFTLALKRPASPPPAQNGHNGDAAAASPMSAAPAAPAPAPAAPAAPREGAAEIERYFMEMVENGCSDLHLSSGTPPMYRKDGRMVTLSETQPLSPEKLEKMFLEIAPEKNEKEFEEARDTDFAHEIPGQARFRCNLFADRRGPGGVFRIIPAEILTPDKIGLSQAVLDLCHLQKGLVVVTGPTGSGKSTTLATMIDYINSNRTDHIITIEDPIEFVHENKKCLVNQREVGLHTQGFKNALRAALREDPDILLVGEMRDLETISIAIETAETGHLVFGTLHTNTAPSTVDRIIDQFPEGRQAQVRTMLSESLKGVVAQTLCRRKGGGRAAAYEILIATNSLSNLIREGKTYQIPSIMQTGKSMGMITMNESLLKLVNEGVVEPQEAYNKAVHKTELKAALQKAGHQVQD